MPEINITKHKFVYNTFGYFRGKAENVQIASYGKKRDPIGAEAYLEVQNQVKREHVAPRMRFVTAIDVDWASQSKSDVEVNVLKYFGIGSEAAITGSYEKAKTAKLKLAKFAIDIGPMEVMLNREADGARNYLADEGNDGRICGEIWLVMEGFLTDQFASAGGAMVATPDGFSLAIHAEHAGAQKIKISAGSTFAYSLYKATSWDHGKTKVDLGLDEKGF